MKYKVWVYGSPFSGKSYFANSFPKVFVINTDGNLQFYKGVEGIVVNSYKEFSQALQNFDPSKYDTLVIDVLDHVYDMAREEFLLSHGIEHESDFESTGAYGKGWTLLREQFWYLISKIANIDTNLVLISHETEKEVKGKLGITTTTYQPSTVPDRILTKIPGIMHFVGRAYKEDSGHKIDFTIDKTTPLNGYRIPMSEYIIGNTYKDFIAKVKEE